MKKVSIGRAWDETSALVKRQPGPLFLVAFGLLALPTIIFQAIAPEAAPGQPPEAGAWMLLIIPLIILSIVGTITITVMAIRDERDAGGAFAHALRRFPVVLAAALIMGIGAGICALPFIVVMSLLVKSEQSLTFLVTLIVLLAFMLLWVRMMLMTPVGAMESGGPIAILKRSWSLTQGETWRLLGFVLLMVVLFVVVTVAITFIVGSVIILIAGQPSEGNLTSVLLALLGGVLQAIWILYFTVMVARIYAQLSGAETSGS